MTPKDKAGLLIATFRKTLFENGNPNNVNDHSRACAIACVEEMLDEAKGYNQPQRIEYWSKVLEILKAKREPEQTTIQQQPEKKTGLQSPGQWYARLEGCKTPEDVDELEKRHVDVINANPDLRRLLVIYKFRLKNK